MLVMILVREESFHLDLIVIFSIIPANGDQ